jgi:glycosyltransferase involved in cell wall biosynthesis
MAPRQPDAHLRRSPSTLAWQVLRAEGMAAFRDRSLDRLAAWRRRRRYRRVDAGGLTAVVPVLSVLPAPPRPDLGGVLVQFLRRQAAAAGPRALLYPERGGYRLEVDAASGPRAAVLPGTLPGILDLRDESFEDAVRLAAEMLGAKALHVEQPAGLPLGSLLRLRRSGLRLVLSLHDFGLFCVRPHLLEQPRLAFCRYCRDDARCAACLRRDWPVDDGFQPARRAVASELLAAADAVVYPSDFMRRRYRELLRAPTATAWVVPPALAPPVPPASAGPVRRVAYVGSVRAHKGALVFEEVAGRFPELVWSAFGGGDPEILRRWRRTRAIAVRGYYRAAALPRLLRRRRVDLALLPSIVPESYGLTLDECWAAGVPVIAFDHGALAERIRERGGGWLVRPEEGAAGVERRLREVLRRPEVPSGRGDRPPEEPRSFADVYRALELGVV